ncbi:MAG: YgjP-like metallopeptidase domain-containing protein [Phocaeicola sp.]
MVGKRILSDVDFKQIFVLPNKRAVHLTFRVKPDGLYVTVPPSATDESVLKGVNELREKLLKHFLSVDRESVSWDFKIEQPHFNLSLLKGIDSRLFVQAYGSEAKIICPPDFDFSQERSKEMLVAAAELAMRHVAQRFLPAILKELSEKSKLPYSQVKITRSKGRWGSCSSKKVINLSCYLMTLPYDLIYYVLVHELAHTVEMNHGELFWRKVDELMGREEARRCREELKLCRMPLFGK